MGWPIMPSEIDTLRALCRYNAQQRQAYLETIWKLPESEWYRDRGASLPSIVDILLRVLDAHKLWFQKVYPGEPEVPEYPLAIRLSRAQAQREQSDVDGMLRDVLRNLTPQELGRRFRFPGEKLKVSLRDTILHMIEVELQHRGEMNALLWQIDIDPPNRDFY
jgi:uncharacterized damage-inducible protein DinB